MNVYNRPYTICHMMSTIDGKITSGVGIDILEEYFEIYTKIEDRLEVKAWRPLFLKERGLKK